MRSNHPRPEIDPALLEILTHEDPGYRPIVDFETWRVALLNFCENLKPENLHNMQRHDETDEVFVVLAGRCLLVVGDGKETAGNITWTDLVPGTFYNVKRGVWHTHALSPEAKVLVVENRDTTLKNSPFCDLSAEQTKAIVAAVQALWSGPET